MLIADIAQHLHNEGIAVLGTNLFYSYLPESPDACVSVLDTGGLEPDKYLPTKEPTFQVFIRSTSYALGRAKLDLVRDALNKVSGEDLGVGGTFFLYIFAISEGGHLGRDDANRDLFSINFKCRTR